MEYDGKLQEMLAIIVLDIYVGKGGVVQVKEDGNVLGRPKGILRCMLVCNYLQTFEGSGVDVYSEFKKFVSLRYGTTKYRTVLLNLVVP